jgi:DNA-binding transcriptional ArsR family regulator
MEKLTLSFEQPAQVFSALGHPVRLAMLELLREGEACVCHIQSVLGLRQAYASQHLNILRQVGLVDSRKEGTRVYYDLVSPGLDDIIDQTKNFLVKLGRISPDELITHFDLSQPECRCPQCIEKQPLAGVYQP